MAQSLDLNAGGPAPKIRRLNRLPVIAAIVFVVLFFGVILYGLTTRGLYFRGDRGSDTDRYDRHGGVPLPAVLPDHRLYPRSQSVPSTRAELGSCSRLAGDSSQRGCAAVSGDPVRT